ncbi:hypothetical protein FXO38_21520 [Capsicum annuum]|nr:hypothetical protein FXO38_21520 [Capsicum annuum]KAF3646017.1 hypothetical protein FXO37_20673 [Capsicum annuum]
MLQHLWTRVGIKGNPPCNLPQMGLLYVMLKTGPPSMFLCPRGDQVLSLYALASNDVFKSIDVHLACIKRTSNHTLVCALISSSSFPRESSLNCTSFPQGIQIPLNPSVPFSGMVGGIGFLCGLTSSDPTVMVCWRFSNNGTDLTYKRIYVGPLLTNLDSGNSQICGIVNGTNRLQCWQWHEFSSSNRSLITSNLAVGQDFVCGLLRLGSLSWSSNSAIAPATFTNSTVK